MEFKKIYARLNKFYLVSMYALLFYTPNATARRNIPLNQMHSRCRVNDTTDLTRLQGKRCVFKLLLHLAVPKETPADFISFPQSAIHRSCNETYRSPFFLALLQSDSDTAKSPKSSPD